MKLHCFVLIVFLLKVGISSPAGKLDIEIQENNENGKTGISGGTDVKIDKIKYIGALLMTEGPASEPIGSVVILNKQWVIAAALYVAWMKPENIKVRVGSDYSVIYGDLVDTAKFFIHPKYRIRNEYNLALIKLKKPLKFSKKVKSISIASELPKTGEDTLITGYAPIRSPFVPNTEAMLQQATVPFLDSATCQNRFNDSTEITEATFCTFKDSVGPCKTDMGSPLVYKNKLIGLFSWTRECGTNKHPAIYSDLTTELQWVKDTIKKNSVSNDNEVFTEE